MQVYFRTGYGISRIDTSMRPYFCDVNGKYLGRHDLANPDVIPHILVRIEAIEDHDHTWAHSSQTYAIIVDPDQKVRVLDGKGREAFAAFDQWDLKTYLSEHPPAFLDSIGVTCANCRGMIGPPGPLARSGQDHYKHILCAGCPK